MTDALREKLVDAGRVLVSEDQGDYVAGHVTLRLPGGDGRFLMKPAGIGLEEMTRTLKVPTLPRTVTVRRA
jgi:L-fuculose-phosphate aldolase